VVSVARLSTLSVGTVVSRYVILLNDQDLAVKPMHSQPCQNMSELVVCPRPLAVGHVIGVTEVGPDVAFLLFSLFCGSDYRWC
jgi:hypothetical protein